jgi:DNA-binding CsgD family transcriptional regulator
MLYRKAPILNVRFPEVSVMPAPSKVKHQARTGVQRKSAVAAHSPAATPGAFKKLPVNLAVLDGRGVIVDVSDAWKKFARDNGLRTSNFGIGKSYLHLCRSGAGAPAELAENLEKLIAGELDLINLVYSCDSPTEARWFSLIALPLRFDGLARAAVLHIDISSLVRDVFGARSAPTANARNRNAVLMQTQMAANAVHGSVGRSLGSQINKMLSDRRRRSSIDAIRRKSGAEMVRVKERLTKQQQEVLRLLGKGKTNAEIARDLFRSPNTIKLHVSAILKSLDVTNRTQAALLASRLFEPGSGTGR